VLVSTVLFLLLAAALAATTIATIRGNKISRDTATASALAHDMIEWFRAQDPVATLSPLLDQYANEAHTEATGPEVTMNSLGEEDAEGKFTRSWAANLDTPGGGMAQLVVTIRWSDPEEHEISAVTYICTHPTCQG
jgi:hypothetical protein